MTNFYTDADLSGAGEFAESAVSLATEFTLPAGTIHGMRARFPSVAGATVLPRLYNAGGSLLSSGTVFDTAIADAWNPFTGGAFPLVVGAGTYRACTVVTRYPALGGFFSGGAITRGDITANRGMFDGGDVAPTQASTATYFVDLDFTAAGGGLVQALPTAVETSAAQTFGRQKSRVIAVASTVEAALTLGRIKSRTLPVALEVDTALVLGGGSGPGRDLETLLGVPAAGWEVSLPSTVWSFGKPEV